MKHYELLYLVTSHVSEAQLETMQAEVSDWISQLGGRIKKHELWARKKLAYPIGREKFGYYILSEFELEAGQLAQLQKKLRLGKDIVRFLIVTRHPISAREILALEAQRRAHELSRAKAAAPAETDVRRARVSQSAVKKDKISLEELDKKLDEILGDDMMR